MLWPEIPESLSSLTAAALRDLAAAIQSASIAVAGSASCSAEDRAEIVRYQGVRAQCKQLADLKDEQERTDAEDAARAAAAAAAAAGPEDGDDGGDGDDPEPDPDHLTGAEVLAKGAHVPTTFGQTAVAVQERVKRKLAPEYLTAVDDVGGLKPGQNFESWGDLSTALVEMSASISGGSNRKYPVAAIKAEYPEHRKLKDGDNFLDMTILDTDEVMAAYCAPATPYYGISCMNTLRRPVFNSLPGFEAPRMKVSIMPSPTLSDIGTTGYGIWADTDDDGVGTKVCQTITCGSPTEYKVYGVWKCLTVKNMLAMAYPELVEAWLNRLGAAHARLAEKQLLNLMGSGTTLIDAPLLGYGATTSIVSTILNYIALYQETQRWDITENLEAWAHRSVLTGMQMDLYRRRNTTGSVNKVASQAEIEGLFRDAGVDIHWFIDVPTWSASIPAVATANTLNLLPQAVDILIAPKGKFALMDRGQLSIGVTGDGLYRDNSSNASNQFTFFFENFEGIVNTNTCPAHTLHIPVCWTGIQVDDNLVNCLGRDELGYQS